MFTSSFARKGRGSAAPSNSSKLSRLHLTFWVLGLHLWARFRSERAEQSRRNGTCQPYGLRTSRLRLPLSQFNYHSPYRRHPQIHPTDQVEAPLWIGIAPGCIMQLPPHSILRCAVSTLTVIVFRREGITTTNGLPYGFQTPLRSGVSNQRFLTRSSRWGYCPRILFNLGIDKFLPILL